MFSAFRELLRALIALIARLHFSMVLRGFRGE
jgi:hypothetical protein